MSSETLSFDAYLRFAQAHPSLFVNPSDGGIEILLEPKAVGQAETAARDRLRGKGLPLQWARVGIAFEDQYGRVLRDAVRFPDGSLGTYIRYLKSPDQSPGVVILPLHDQHVLLLRHYRHATRLWHLEVPRGFGEPNTSVEENAERELLEELNASVTRLNALGPLYPDAGFSSDRVELFYAEIASWSQPHGSEPITDVIPVSIAELEQRIRDGRISDAFTIAAYSRARLLRVL